MAITTDAFIEFFGDPDDISSSPSAVSNTSFSAGTSDLTAWTNDDDAPYAELVFTGTFGSAPTANSVLNIHAALVDIDGTNDTPAPSSNWVGGYLGSIVLSNATTQTHRVRVELPNTETSQVYNFYVENQSGQTLSSGWKLVVVPKALGPHG